MNKRKPDDIILPPMRCTELVQDGNVIHATFSNAGFLDAPAVPSPDYVPNCTYCRKRDGLQWVGNFYSYAEETYYPFYVCEDHASQNGHSKESVR